MSASRRATIRTAIQITGFLAGLGLLGWCAALALEPDNRSQLEALREARMDQIGALLALSAVSVLLNGVIFWATLLPARRIPLLDVSATNAVATLLSYLPFKLSVVARAVVHNRRNEVPLLTIGAWFVAVGVILGAWLVPVAGIGLVRARFDVVWVAGLAGGLFVTGSLVVISSRLFAHDEGRERIAELTKSFGPVSALVHTRAFHHLHTGLNMLASTRAVGATMVMRVADLTAHALRFSIAGSIVGQQIGFDQAFLIASIYFTIAVASPFGMIGVREMGTAGFAGILAIANSDEFAVVALTVSATEAIVTIALAVLGIVWLRPDRLLSRQQREQAGQRA